MRTLPPLLSLFLLLPLVSSFYLPGVAPTDYRPGEKVPLHVNRLTPGVRPSDQKVREVVSYDYYHTALNFCQPPAAELHTVSESLGSILFGDRIVTSPFDVRMLKNETCKALCPRSYNARQAAFVNRRIFQNYNLNWLIDGLPAATPGWDEQGEEEYTLGFPLGVVKQLEEEVDDGRKQVPVLYNHYDIWIDYHALSEQRGNRVVGVLVQPASIHSRVDASAKFGADCSAPMQDIVLNQEKGQETEVLFTYSVYWRESPTAWATRWDRYLRVYESRIHWFSLVNSTIIVVFLSGMTSMVLLRALRKDIARYNQLDLNEDVQDDSGWKLVHGDVFRAPKNPMLLSIFLGSGAQLFFMTGATIVFALLGFLSPSNRGALGTVMILLYALFGSIGGYVSSRAYKSLGGEAWKRNIAFTPLFIPATVFSTFFLLNLFLWARESSGAVPFGTMLAIIAIWFVISLPLSFAGSWYGFFKSPALEAPTRTNQIPRQIPEQSWWMSGVPNVLVVGILPFLAIFVDVYFILSSMWSSKVYYMFGFLFVCFGVMIVTTATVTILITYFLLCSENYHWQWRAFFTAGASSFYIFVYALIWWVSKMSLGGFTSNVLYLGYSALVSFLFFVLTGTIGFVSTYFFVRRIYGSIKIE